MFAGDSQMLRNKCHFVISVIAINVFDCTLYITSIQCILSYYIYTYQASNNTSIPVFFGPLHMIASCSFSTRNPIDIRASFCSLSTNTGNQLKRKLHHCTLFNFTQKG